LLLNIKNLNPLFTTEARRHRENFFVVKHYKPKPLIHHRGGGPEKYARSLIDVFWLKPNDQIQFFKVLILKIYCIHIVDIFLYCVSIYNVDTVIEVRDGIEDSELGQ